MSIWVCGDTHGEMGIRRISNQCWKEGRKLTRADYLIILGDFGLIFHNLPTEPEKYWLKWLESRPYTVLFVDGNHDNHPKLQALPKIEMFGGMVGQINSNVFHLRRGEVYTIDNRKVFTFGGASSMDKANRIEGIDWWREEVCNWAECEYALTNLEKHNNHVDLILTHTIPATLANIYLHSIGLGDAEPCPVSTFLDTVATTVTFSQWYAGHWHTHWDFGKYSILYEKIRKVPIDFTV